MLGNYFIAHRNVRKIAKIDKHIGLTIAGGVADAQNVIDTLKYYANTYRLEHNVLIPVSAAARLTSNVFVSARLFPYYVSVLVGGVDESGPTLFDIDLFGTLTPGKYFSTGSGSPVAYGILESEFQEGMKVEEVVPIGVQAINAAIKRNAGTGDGFDVIAITESGFTEYSFEQKQQILAEVSERSQLG